MTVFIFFTLIFCIYFLIFQYYVLLAELLLMVMIVLMNESKFRFGPFPIGSSKTVKNSN